MKIAVQDIAIDNLETTPEAYDFMVKTNSQTLVEFLQKFEPYEEMDEKITDDICFALGYLIWRNIKDSRN